ncbi:MAG: dienelactone hydrolase family protein [Devosia sp.]
MSGLEVVLPPGGSGPGVFVVHPWWGRNATVLAYGRALAELGFVVGLPDGFEGEVVSGRDEAQGLVEKHWQAAPARLAADFDAFAARPEMTGPVGGVGFSFGGFQLLKLQETLPLHRVVTYYADRVVDLKVPVLGHFAEDDPFADDQEGMIRALQAAGAPSEAVVYPGTRHWFAEKDRPEFDAGAARAAFERTVAFLRG